MKIFAFLITNLASILSAIKAVEVAVGASNGATKKQLVMNVALAAAQAGETIPESHIQAISTLIDTTVTTLNKSGVLSGTAK